VVASWYSENNRDVPLEVLDGETEFSFMEGEAVKFDCFPTLCTTFTAPVLQQPVERSPLLVPPELHQGPEWRAHSRMERGTARPDDGRTR